MNDPTSAVDGLLREICAREGEALEAYGRALKTCGSGGVPLEISLRDLADASVRASAGAASLSMRVGAAYLKWGLSCAGIRLAPAADPAPSIRIEKAD
jgi:hypothetical protein